MMYSLDIETYMKYDGADACWESILDQQPSPKARLMMESQERIVGKYYPVLNSNEFILGCIRRQDGKEWYFHTPSSMWSFIEELTNKAVKQRKKVYLYAHNHQYDFLGYGKEQFFREDLKKLTSNPLLYILQDVTYFCDTMFYYRYGLSKVAEALGMEGKLDMPLSVWSPDELKAYISKDCEITLNAMLHIKKTLSSLGFNPRKLLTAGQTAMNCFLTWCHRNDTKKYFMHDNAIYKSPNEDWMRIAFRGGRVEAFQQGKHEHVYGKDRNSSYSASAKNMPFPDLKEEIMIEKPLERGYDINRLLEHIGVIQCSVRAPENIRVPYLPIRYHPTKKSDKSQIFPKNVTMKSVWTNAQIKKALTLGYELLDVDKILIYKTMSVNPLKDYLTELYNIRLKSDSQTKLVIKLMMNAFLMKFAQKSKETELKLVPRWKSPELEKEGWEFEAEWNENYIMKRANPIEYTPIYANPLISLLITSDAQNEVYDEMVKTDSGTLLYVDTDGFYYAGMQPRMLEGMGDELGGWDELCDNANADFIGEKKYKINDEIKLSGIGKDSIVAEEFKLGGKMSRKKQISMKFAKLIGKPELAGTFMEEAFTLQNVKEEIMHFVPDYIEDLTIK